MRLTHLKLAGFKSFVDPTQVPLPGQIVGIVGPNGCGKSNVIDAVRWVLGESSARHLRGETMQDVIFNGAGERKPAGRASVEMHFDNSLGKAGGPWSQYGEIVVKRVLQRDGDSSYFINNLHVRRRDVADIFLGTGLGGRAYAIIEQGTISRIVEAKPEEIRVFLEEAAGVSKYRERRRETELRLADTRSNLTRLEDIQRELAAQLEHLTAQAAVTQRYNELKTELARTQQLLWLVKKQELGAQRSRLSRELERASIELEAEVARLRETEKRVEELRGEHYAAGDALHGAQAALYESNAEVARLEKELEFVRDNRARTEQRMTTARARMEQGRAQLATLSAARSEWDGRLAAATETLEASRCRLDRVLQSLPAAEAAFRAQQSDVEASGHALAQREQTWRVEETRREHAEKLLAQHAQRRDRLLEERGTLVHTDTQVLEALERRMGEIDAKLKRLDEGLVAAEGALPAAEGAAQDAAAALETATHQWAGSAARMEALQQVQKRVTGGERLSEWLVRRGLDRLPRLWQEIDVEAGWEDALEATLRERLNAVEMEDVSRTVDCFADPPPSKLVVVDADRGGALLGFAAPDRGLSRLIDFVRCDNPALVPLLEDWLARVYVTEDAVAAVAARERLEAGEMILNREGHGFTRHGIHFHAPESELHGVISRQREIESLGAAVATQESTLTALRSTREEADAAIRITRSNIDTARQELAAMRQERHRLQLEHVKYTEQSERVRSRDAQIERELVELDEQHTLETTQLRRAVETLARLEDELASARSQLAAARDRFLAAEREADLQRERRQEADREFQETEFERKSCAARIEEMTVQQQLLDEQVAREAVTLAELEAERLRFDEAPIGEQLQQALARRTVREDRLSVVRQALESAEASLRAAEEERLAAEHRLDPLRERINELRLKEQEARLLEEGFAQQLREAGADEAALATHLEKSTRSGTLNNEIARLEGEIVALGAVNLAALEELAAATERKSYLDAQSADLTDAVETLQAAIRRIDRETRERLLTTFDQVNIHLGEMFPALFGGGQAKLVLTGEEILDSGVQVIAQPPGKKNTSIHLLSGGEKALAALSLVFALFLLNPAPFCLLDEVDAPLDDTNTERFCALLKKMAHHTQFIVISHNKITMEIAEQLVGVTMQELGVSRVVAVDVEEAMRMKEEATA